MNRIFPASGANANGAGAPEIEVTPEMIEAGMGVFLGAYPDTGAGDELDRRMVVAIYGAMVRVSASKKEAALNERA